MCESYTVMGEVPRTHVRLRQTLLAKDPVAINRTRLRRLQRSYSPG